MRKPQPTKAHRVVTWFLVYRVAVADTLTERHERIVCERVKLPWEAWEAAKAQFPQLMARVVEKRARRRLWQECFGPVPDGWTPPDPNRPQSENFPAHALTHWRTAGIGNLVLGAFGERWQREAIEEEAVDAESEAPAEKRAAYARAMQRAETR